MERVTARDRRDTLSSKQSDAVSLLLQQTHGLSEDIKPCVGLSVVDDWLVHSYLTSPRSF